MCFARASATDVGSGISRTLALVFGGPITGPPLPDSDELAIVDDLSLQEQDPVLRRAEDLTAAHTLPAASRTAARRRSPAAFAACNCSVVLGPTRFFTISGSLIPTHGVRAILRFSTASVRTVLT